MKSEFYEQKTVLGALLRSEPVNYRTKHKICDPWGWCLRIYNDNLIPIIGTTDTSQVVDKKESTLDN